MNIEFRVRDIALTEELRQEVERRIGFALDRFAPHLERVSVYAADLNGPRGGVDKLCRLTAHVRGARPVAVIERADSLVAAAGSAAARLAARIRRRLGRRSKPGWGRVGTIRRPGSAAA